MNQARDHHVQYTLNVWSRGKQFCFPKSPDVSRDEVEGNIRTRRSQQKKQITERATTAELYPGRETFVFDQGHVKKNQPITVLVLLSESLGI